MKKQTNNRMVVRDIRDLNPEIEIVENTIRTPNRTRLIAQQQQAVFASANPWNLSFTATRETNSILAPLYFCLFGPINSPTSYLRVFNQLGLMPVILGVTASVAFSVEQNGDLLFTYTLGVNSDVIRIKSKSRNTASEILEQMRGGAAFTCPGFRYTLSTPNYDAQFQGIPVNTALNTMGGVTAQDTIEIDPSIDPMQYKDKRVDVEMDIAADMNYTFVGGFINDPANLNVTNAYYFNNALWTNAGIFDRPNC